MVTCTGRSLAVACLVFFLATSCDDGSDTGAPAAVRVRTSEAPEVPRHREDWKTYPTQIDGRLALVLVDLGFGREPSIGSCPHLARVVVPLKDPGPEGVGSASAEEALARLEDQLLGDLGPREEWRFVGRVRTAGEFRYYFYVADVAAFGARVGEATRRRPDDRPRLEFELDEGWRLYRSDLYPSEEREEWISDMEVVETLRSQGDPLVDPRPVTHWLYFATGEDRARFRRSIEGRGFAVAGEEDGISMERPFQLVLERVGSVDLERIHAEVMELVEAARACGGEYDGWETQVKK
ncbi:MAG: DUF695 domain-containing protein [Planctomycetes bacterium]|nr:DUF695 domain-containing protein [Planctomycetota bacterium]